VKVNGRFGRIYRLIFRADLLKLLFYPGDGGNIFIWNAGWISSDYMELCRPQWPLARTLGSWFRIPFKAWMSVCMRLFCVVLCTGSGTSTGWSPVQGILSTMCRFTKLNKRRKSNKWM
jgi:hypothetical protein